ncbi:MAG TPA: DNA polymerase III subunit delta [Acetobacteraceae bacterium]|nr:DNA polymerase III subunit delta [Acetobacteraceae bacterium]
MKLAPQRVAAFLRNPGDCRVVLLYGDDAGMIRQRAETLVRAVAGSLDDPFLVAELARDRLDRLADEAASVPLTGGRRVVRVRDATDAATGPAQAVLDSRAQALVVLEAPGIAARSKLRSLLEAAPDGAAVGCYPEEGRALEETIRRALDAATAGVDQDALSWLTGQLGADQVSTQAELEKLSLCAGPAGRVDLEMAMHCVGDAAGLSLDDALFAATAGDLATADRALELAVAEGTAPVGVLRGGLMHLQRLYRARLLMETGMSAGEAARAARPPVFFRRVAAFTKALDLWSPTSLAAAMAGLSQAERNCKRTGAPDHTLSRHAVLTLARRAMAAR